MSGLNAAQFVRLVASKANMPGNDVAKVLEVDSTDFYADVAAGPTGGLSREAIVIERAQCLDSAATVRVGSQPPWSFAQAMATNTRFK